MDAGTHDDRIAVLSDVHGNCWALRAVLADVDKHRQGTQTSDPGEQPSSCRRGHHRLRIAGQALGKADSIPYHMRREWKALAMCRRRCRARQAA